MVVEIGQQPKREEKQKQWQTRYAKYSVNRHAFTFQWNKLNFRFLQTIVLSQKADNDMNVE